MLRPCDEGVPTFSPLFDVAMDSFSGREAITIQRPGVSDKRCPLDRGINSDIREEVDHVGDNFLTKRTSQRALSICNALSDRAFPLRLLSHKVAMDMLFPCTPLFALLGKEIPQSYVNQCLHCVMIEILRQNECVASPVESEKAISQEYFAGYLQQI